MLSKLKRALGAGRGRLVSVLLGSGQRVLGGSRSPGDLLLRAAILITSMGVVAAVWTLVIQGISPQRSSSGVVAPIFRFATSTWSYLLLELILLRGMLRISNSRLARQSAGYLGMDPEAVRRFGAEAKSTDGTTRVIATTEDTVEEIREQLRVGMRTEEDDEISPRSAALDESTEDAPALPAGLPELFERSSTSWRAQLKLWRMDAASSLQTGELFWQIIAPAAVVFGALVITLGIWLQWWVYPLLMSVAAFVGVINWWRIRKQRVRELSKLRAESGSPQWDACSVLIKGPIQAGGTEMHYAWFNGDTYASNSASELTEEVAKRVHQLLHGEQPDPSVLEKYARNLEDYYADLDGWRHNVEEHQISEELIKTVEESPQGIIPLAKLIEDVVLHDRGTRLWGLMESGMGYDPELVRQCYEQLHPTALVEEEMEIEVDGERHSITAVRLRTDPLPAEYSEVRAQFASRFKTYAQYEPLYELPETDPEDAIIHNPRGVA